MNCSQIMKLKEAYVDGLLDSSVRAAVEAHAGVCAQCRYRLDLAQSIKARMSRAVKSLLGRRFLAPEKAAAIRDQVVRRGAASPFRALGLPALGVKNMSLRRSALAVPVLGLLVLASATVGAAQFAG